MPANSSIKQIAKRVSKKLFPKKYDSLLRKATYNRLHLPEISCHLYGLFIKYDGSVYPCCMTRGSEYLKIGHISDPDLFDLVKSYDKYCYCQAFKLRKALPTDKVTCELLDIEVSLACNGKYAMCCIGAPSWRGKYDLYNELTKLIDWTKSKEILVQGGEVLIQKKTLKWISGIRTNHPDIRNYLVTNGNANAKIVEMVEELFDRLYVSLVGFMPETYRTVMGMNLNKTIQFVEELVKRGKVKVFLKYLITPINAHKASLLDWAILLNMRRISIDGAANSKYIHLHTSDHYWEKIFERTSKKIKSSIIGNRRFMIENSIVIAFDKETKELFGIHDGFIEEKELGRNLMDRSLSRLFCPRDHDFHS